MSDQNLQDQLSKKLSALMALALVPDVQKKNTAEKVELLMRFGISNQEIADIVGTTKGTVEVLKSRAIKRRK
jgi:DNA-binding CsgD family transcriptional regulator